MPLSRFNQTAWPADGPHRELLDLLDAVHRRHGCRSLRDIGRSMHLSYTRVHDIVRGESLPVDEAQIQALVLGIVGMADEESQATAHHAAELFVKARRARDELDEPRVAPDLSNTPTETSDPALAASPETPPEASQLAPAATAEPDDATSGISGRPNRRRRRRTLALIVAVVAAVVMVVGLTWWVGSSPSEGTSEPHLAPPQPPAAPASMQVTAENPGGCSPSYAVEVTAQSSDPRIVGNRLWIVSELYADMTRNDPNSLYFAKTPVVLSNGRFTTRIVGNTEPGVRTERYLLVVSPDDASNQDLQLSLSSDRAHDDQYPDYRRTRLQLANTEVATGPDLTQRC